MKSFGILVSDEVINRLMNQDLQLFYIGGKPNVVDFQNFLSGVDFEPAWLRKQSGELCGEQDWYLGLEDFRATKTASGRPKDLLDLIFLDEITG